MSQRRSDIFYGRKPSPIKPVGFSEVFPGLGSSTDHKTFFHTWNFDESMFYSQPLSSGFQSPTFNSPPESNLVWAISVYPRGKLLDASSSSSHTFLTCIYLKFMSVFHEPVNVRFRFSLRAGYVSPGMSCAQELCATTGMKEHNFTSNGGVHNNRAGFDDIMQLNENPWIQLQHHLLTTFCCFPETRKVTVILEMMYQCNNTVGETSLPTQFVDRQFVEEMSQLLKSGQCSDLIIVSKNVEIPVHKSMLVARSSVFAAMFSHDLLESQTSCISINEFDPDTLLKVLQFMYTGVNLDFKDAFESSEVLKAAEKYDMITLKTMCEQYICKNLTTENVIKMLVLSDMYNCTSLKKTSLRFIMGNKENIVPSPEWSEFMKNNPSLALDTMMNLLVNIN